MPSARSLRDQGIALMDDQKKLVLDDSRPWSDKRAEFDRLDADIKAVTDQYRALKDADSRGTEMFNDLRADVGSSSALARGLAATGNSLVAPPRMSLTMDQAAELHNAASGRRACSIDIKNATDSTSITPAGIPTYVLPPVTMLREPSRVLSLLPTVGTEHPTVTWYSTTGTTAAAAVAEGGTKPTSTLAYTPNTTSATKLAHVVEVTDETLSDFPSFLAALQNDMMAGLIKAESSELLNATVTGAHNWPGLLNASGVGTYARSTETNLDAISIAFDNLRNGTSFAQPDGIVMHPTTWGNTRRLKDSNGRYYLAPDPTKETDLSLWGVPVVLTTQIAAGTALVGNFAQAAMVYIRDGMRIETGVGEAQFKNNTVLVRCEERLILTVPRASALVKITNLA